MQLTEEQKQAVVKGEAVRVTVDQTECILIMSPGTLKPARGGHFKTDRGVND